MKKTFPLRPLFLFLLMLYGIMLYIFYVKYVPFVKPYQSILLPVLFFVFVLAADEIKWGVLFFVFTFPLINNLPYFFNIHENIPHAPTAPVLFLFFFMGCLVHCIFKKKLDAFKHPIFRPMVLFSLVVLISASITFFRYANFFPFYVDSIYELQTNAHGLSAGGAIMSVVFNSLNYLTGIAFFFILIKSINSREFIRKILIVLCVSTFLSMLFGMYQHFKDMEFGNNPISINHGFINATFKDGLSFGAYIGIITALILGIAFGLKGFMRIFSLLVVILSLYMVFFAGSKSGFFCLMLALFVFMVFSLKKTFNLLKIRVYSFNQIITALSFALIFVSLGVIGFFTIKKPVVTEITKSITIIRANVLKNQLESNSVLKRRSETLWKLAIPMIKEYPLTGVGIGGYIIEVSNYAEIFETKIITPESAENYLLQVGSELGFIGLFLVLWIFWEIIREMKRCHQKIPDDDGYKFILIGAVAGIFSFFINIQVHTYIGSYEIKYTFWLLVGLLFALGKDMGVKAEDGRGIRQINQKQGQVLFSRKFKIAGGILIVLYGAIHLWNSSRSLSLSARTEKVNIKQDFGFYQQEKTDDGREFRWTRKYGGTTITVEKPVIEIPILASHPDIEKKPVKMKIFLVKDFFKQKKLLDEIMLTRNIWKTYSYSIPEEVGQEILLLFKVSRTWNPLKVKGAHDPRNLGIAVGKIQFKEK